MKTLWKSIKITLAFCVLLSVGYVAVLWLAGKVITPNGGEAEVITLNGEVVGAANVGQTFTELKYFWGRPSAVDYNGSGSGGSNKGTTNPEYLAEIEQRIDTFLVAHPYLSRQDIPSEIITASASGLDPDISPASAYIQARRVAENRGIGAEEVVKLIDSVKQRPWLGLFGTEKVNVLRLNASLDQMYPVTETPAGQAI